MTVRRVQCQWLLTPDGWQSDQVLALDDRGYISAVLTDGCQADVRLAGPVVPGMVNVHSHAHQRLMAGLSGRRSDTTDSFWSWREQMYSAIASLTADELGLLASYVYLELLEGGYTCQGEFHYAHRLAGDDPLASSVALIAAAERVGCALTLLPVWYRYGGFGKAPVSERQQTFVLSAEEILDLLVRLDALVAKHAQLRIGLAPHSLRAVDIEELAELLIHVSDRPIHIHIAEQPAEVQSCRERHGCGPISLLDRHIRIDSGWCLIHATHADPEELAVMQRSGCTVGLCPSTEADLGDGLFPTAEFLGQGGRLAIGSDSNLATSAPGELRLLEWFQRLLRHERNVLCSGPSRHPATNLWLHAAIEGARALAQPCGQLTPGHRADLIMLSPAHPLLRGLGPEAMLDTWIMAEQAGMVDQVWVAGRCQVAQGRHRLRAELEPEFVQLRARLLART